MRPLYNCRVYNTPHHSILLNKNYRTLLEIAQDLNVTYQFIADISSRKNKKMYQQFKFYPRIEINKL